jgi:Fic family protein
LKPLVGVGGFESIHPFEDGNGRVGRAIVDMALAQGAQIPYRLHGISSEMRRQQRAYYAALNAAQCGDGDVSGWRGRAPRSTDAR